MRDETRWYRRVDFGWRVAAACGLAAPAFGCHARVPGPEIGEHVDVAMGSCVPFPPPAVRVDEVTARPTEKSVWVDGEWGWTGRSYVWRAGAWVVPPLASEYARASVFRLSNGALVFFPGHWHPPVKADAGIDLGATFHCATPPEPEPVIDAATEGAAASDARVDADLQDTTGEAPPASPDRDATLDAPPSDATAAREVIPPPD